MWVAAAPIKRAFECCLNVSSSTGFSFVNFFEHALLIKIKEVYQGIWLISIRRESLCELTIIVCWLILTELYSFYTGPLKCNSYGNHLSKHSCFVFRFTEPGRFLRSVVWTDRQVYSKRRIKEWLMKSTWSQKIKKKPNTLSIKEYILYPECGRIGTI